MRGSRAEADWWRRRGHLLAADEEIGVVLAVGSDADVDPELDEEPDVDFEPVDSERDVEPVADLDASVIDERHHLAAWRRRGVAG